MLIALLVPLILAILLFTFVLARAAIEKRAGPNVEAMVLGGVVNFFDTLGIGSFAPTTAWMKFRRMVPDRLLPPTMLVGLTPPAMAESIIFLILLGVMVDPVLLFGCALAVLMGGLVGAPLVARARVWIVQAAVALGLRTRGDRLRDDQPSSVSGRRDRGRAADGPDNPRDRRQLRLRSPAELRRWQLRSDSGDAEPDGHGPEADLPDHGGRRRGHGGRRLRAAHPDGSDGS